MISNTDDTIDSRDVIARIEELREEWAESTGDDPDDYSLSEDDWSVGLGDDGAAEIVALIELDDQGRGIPDWAYGVTLVHEDYFEEYAQQLAEDIGAIDPDAGWPLSCIDWEAAADALKVDYTTVEFGGVDYWGR